MLKIKWIDRMDER